MRHRGVLYTTLVLAALAVGAAIGLAVGRQTAADQGRVALARMQERDQLDAARAYLTGLAGGQWSTVVSVASGHIWPTWVLGRGPGRYCDTAYQLPTARARLKAVTSVRLGPAISADFLESAQPFELQVRLPSRAGANGWASREHPPRAVLYDQGNQTYFVFVIWENGGWRVFGTPLLAKASYLKYKDYLDALRADGVTEGRAPDPVTGR